MIIALAFIAGLLIGSFLNVCIFRLPRDLSVVTPSRSFCPGCERTIAWYDNVPLLSYVLLGGRCRYCNERIPWRYPFVELVTGIAFALSVWMFGVTLEALKYVVFSAIMIDLVVTDFETRILPDEFTIGGTIVGLVFAWFVPLEPDVAALVFLIANLPYLPKLISLLEGVLGAAIGSGIVWFVAWVYQKVRHREGMGMGDFKMMALIGAFLGLRPTLFTFFLAALLGSVVGPVYALVAKRKLIARLQRHMSRGQAMGAVMMRYQLPFGSFLGLAAMWVAFGMR
jgi:leader peptidase (prepilin peptidase)/N-methyltransferase